MNFDFSEEALEIGREAKRTLARHGALAGARRVLEGKAPYDEALWSLMGELGWASASVPEEYGGVGMSVEMQCMLAFELGHANAAVPFSSSLYFAASIIEACGSSEQKQRWLPELAAARSIGTFAFAEGLSGTNLGPFTASVAQDGTLSGVKWPVPDGTYADFAIVAAREGSNDGALGFYVVDLNSAGVQRERLATLDPTRDQARVALSGVRAQRLGTEPVTSKRLEALVCAASVPLAFELLGGAQACLDMAVDYAKLRYAFGRPIGSFQAIKHKLAEMYIAVELARSNAYFAAWTLSGDPSKTVVAASAALVCASNAFQLCAKENIQVHGGFGVTWEADCHLYLRRAKSLAALSGPSSHCKERIVSELILRPELITG